MFSAFAAAPISTIGNVLNSPIFGSALSLGGSLFSAGQSSKEASKNRKFQLAMYQTRYQKTMADMKKAGLNPILAGKLGVSGSFTGAMPTVPDYGQSIASGFSAFNQGRQTDIMGIKADAEVDKMQSEEDLNVQQAELLREEIPKIRAQIQQIKADEGLKTAITAIPQAVADLIGALRSLGGVKDEKSLKEKLTIVIKKDASDYEKPWFNMEYNKQRQLR